MLSRWLRRIGKGPGWARNETRVSRVIEGMGGSMDRLDPDERERLVTLSLRAAERQFLPDAERMRAFYDNIDEEREQFDLMRRTGAFDRAQQEQIVVTLGDSAPLLANMVEGGNTPVTDASDLEALGYSIAIFPGGIVRALAGVMEDYYASLAHHGTTAPFRDRMLDFDGLNARLGTAEMLARGKRYDG